MVKVIGEMTKKMINTAAVSTISLKVKEEMDKKMKVYKKKFAFLALELGFFVLGFNFFMLGIAGYLSKVFSKDSIFVIIGISLIILGFILGKYMKQRKPPKAGV